MAKMTNIEAMAMEIIEILKITMGDTLYVVFKEDYKLHTATAVFNGINGCDFTDNEGNLHKCDVFDITINSENPYDKEYENQPLDGHSFYIGKDHIELRGWCDGDDGHCYSAKFFKDKEKANDLVFEEIKRLSKQLF